MKKIGVPTLQSLVLKSSRTGTFPTRQITFSASFTGSDMTIYSDYRSNLRIFPKEQVQIFFEDNNLKDNLANRELLSAHFNYFCFLQHIFNIHEKLPLYLNPKDPKPYTPVMPPRALTTFFPDLDHLWATAAKQVRTCFAYAPSNLSRTPPKYPPKRLAGYSPHIHITSALERRAVDYLKKNAYSFQNDIWLDIEGILYPISMPLAIRTLSTNFIHSKPKTTPNQHTVYRFYNRFRYVLTEVEPYLPQLIL